MPPSPHPIEQLRGEVTTAIKRGTDLIADLARVADRLPSLVPDVESVTAPERWTETAKLAGIDATMPERLEQLVESLADLLGGLTESDHGEAWLRHRRARLAAGDADTEAA